MATYRMILLEHYSRNPNARPFGLNFKAESAEAAHNIAVTYADCRNLTLLTVKTHETT